jgi:hypothetical protein
MQQAQEWQLHPQAHSGSGKHLEEKKAGTYGSDTKMTARYRPSISP